MRLHRSICAGTILLFSAIGGLLGTAYRPHIVRFPRPTPESIGRSERLRTILVEGWSVTPAEAAQLEVELAHDSENLSLRLRLMSYYLQHLLNDRHEEHVLWLIEKHPDSDIFQDAELITRMADFESNGAASVFQARRQALWKSQADRFSSSPRVLRNAANAISSTEPALAVQYVKTARQADPGNTEWTTWLARIYADAVRWTYWDGKGVITFTGDPADYRNDPFMLPLSMCRNLRTEVETSTDATLVRAVGEMLMREARLLSENNNPTDSPPPITPDVEQMVRFGEILVRRAGALEAKPAE